MLTTHQLKLQEAILLKVHKGCTIEQAREKELGEGCKVSYKPNSYTTITTRIVSVRYDYIFVYVQPQHRNYEPKRIEYKNINIIGLPPTLERTLVALGDVFGKGHRIIRLENKIVCIHRERLMQNRNFEDLCDRKLINSDGTPCDLFQQDISTQDTIYSILCKDG